MITRNFNLFLSAGRSVPLVINANQAEEGEQWVFSLFQEDGTPYTPTDGSIVGIKSDGYLISNSGTVVDGKVVISETKQMTAAAGKAVFELRIDGLTHGTANFIVLVEEDPTNEGIVSDSDLSLIEEALSAVSPLPTGGTVGQVLTKTANGSAWSNAGTPTQEQVADAVSDWADEHITVETGVVIDTSLSVAGAAADAKKTGDELSDLKSAISTLTSIPTAVKRAMDTLFSKMAVEDDDGYSDEYATIHAWATAVNVVSISALFTPTDTVYVIDSLDSLRDYLAVTASYDDGTSSIVTSYTLSGELTEGTSTITATYEGVSTTFNVTVSGNAWKYTSDMGLLSAQDFVTEFNNTNLSALSEVATSDGLELSYTGASALTGKNANYSFDPSVYTTESVLNFSIKIIDMCHVASGSSMTTSNGAMQFRCSDGAEGSNISFARYLTATGTPRLRYKVADAYTWGNKDLSLNTWHDVEVVNKNGKQTIKIDGEVIVENANPSTQYTTANKLYIFGNTASFDVFLDNIEFRWQ